MTRTRTVSVITRTKDRIVLLRRAIESVLVQTYPHWRMIIVNDGGPREPVENLVAHYEAEANGRIEVVHNEQSLGMHGASGVGIEHATGDLLAMHDDDDSWAPDFLTVALSSLESMKEEFPSVRGVATYCNWVMERVQGNLIHVEAINSFNGWVPKGMLSLDRVLAGNFIPPISFVFERSAFDDLDGPYEIIPYLGDWDFLIRFLTLFDVYVVPQYLAFYHWRTANDTAFGNSIIAEIERHRFYHQLLLNHWLRADLAAGRFGVGCYANLRAHFPNTGAPQGAENAAGIVQPSGDGQPPAEKTEVGVGWQGRLPSLRAVVLSLRAQMGRRDKTPAAKRG